MNGIGSRAGAQIRPLSSLEPVRKGLAIRFTALNYGGLRFGDEFVIHWRVTNTGEAANEAKDLRCDFYPSDWGTTRTEELSYRGVHFVEAFLVRRRDDRLCGTSEPFFVVVE